MPRGKPHKLGDDHAALLALLPRPLFRQADAFDVADALHMPRWQAMSWWNALAKYKLIERTNIQMGRGKKLKRYWWRRAVTGKGTPLAENLP